jgi:hypothetical protein
MDMLALYAYVEGSDIADIEIDLFSRFSAFVAGWGVGTAHVVNVKRPRSPNLRDGDLPDWDLGLNFTVDHLPREKIQELVRFLSKSAKDTGREFVIGARGEDWCSVGTDPRANVVELLAEQLA